MSRKEIRACKFSAKNELCKICDNNAHGCHFGVFCCRACAAFFRRTILLDMIYRCRRNNDCEIHKSVRCMCRKCRFEKCLKMGMKKELLSRTPDFGTHQSQTHPSALSVPITNVVVVTPLQIAIENAEKSLYCTLDVMFNNASHNPVIPENLPLLDAVKLGIDHIRQRRSQLHKEELVLMENFALNSKFDENLKQNWLKVNNMASREFQIYGEFLCYIRSFLNLSSDQRWLLFRQFCIPFQRFDRSFEVYRVLGNNRNDERTVTFNGQVIKSMVDIYQAPKEKPETIGSFMKVVGACRSFFKTGITDVIKELEISETEFYALTLHFLWLQPVDNRFSQETLKIIKENRKKAFNELNNSYLTNPNDNFTYVERIAEFMSLMSALDKNLAHQREAIIMADFFADGIINPTIVSLIKHVN